MRFVVDKSHREKSGKLVGEREVDILCVENPIEKNLESWSGKAGAGGRVKGDRVNRNAPVGIGQSRRVLGAIPIPRLR